MSPKRKDRVAPPQVPGSWDIRFGTSEAAKGWGELCTQAPANTMKAWELMRSNPRPDIDSRHKRLSGDLASRSFDGRMLEQWQIEVTGGGRIWYLVDDDAETVWVVQASCGHPNRTE